MPNLIKLMSLRDKYNDSVSLENRVKNKDVEFLAENFTKSIDRIEKAFQPQRLNPDILTYFEKEKEAHVVMLFIDITSFSTKASLMSNNELSKYLDYYYDKTIPIIYKYGGEVEKIIGDGIICVFGKPFLNDELSGLIKKADNCSKEIITEHESSDWEVKVALHDGLIQYYKNKTIILEYTIIGQPLTDLFRLESVSTTKAVNYYYESEYDKKNTSNIITTSIKHRSTYWKRSGKIKVNLKGTKYQFIRNYEKIREELEFNKGYDFEWGVRRIERIFKQTKVITETKDQIPNNNSDSQVIYSKNTIVVVNVRFKKLNRANKILYAKAITTEIIKICQSNDNYQTIKITGEDIIIVFNTPLKSDVREIFNLGARVTSIFKIANDDRYSIKEKVEFGIGISYGELLFLNLNNGENDVFFHGEVYEEARELSRSLINRIIVDNSIYINLSERQKGFLTANNSKDYYFGSVIIIGMDNWQKNNF